MTITDAEELLILALEHGDFITVETTLRYIALKDPTRAKRLVDVLEDGLKARGLR